MAHGKSRPADRPARIAIVDDHPMVREGLTARIARHADLEVCGDAADVDEALRLVQQTGPDLVVIDISLKGGNGIDLIKQIRSKSDTVKMLVSSMHDESLYAERALRAGALGYINKQEMPEKVIEAIRHVLAGKVYLSPKMAERMLNRSLGRGGPAESSPLQTLSDRELEVFELIGQGRSTREIAEQLSRSVHTIETHREKIKIKLNLASGAELQQRAVQWVLERK
jgi:DNA-binding NarL/FixJ family response regulator